VIKRKRLLGLPAPEVLLDCLDIALTSLDCGRDCCSAVSGGCSNVWDSMMHVKGGVGGKESILEADMFEYRANSEFTHAIQSYRSRADEENNTH
jgi:hypothetical protein